MSLDISLIENALHQLTAAAYPSPIAIEVVDETGSTNADLMARVKQLNLPTVLIARHQTAGKGRAGRNWHSQADATLTFSIAWPFDCSMQRLSGLSLAVGVVIAERLRQLGAPVSLKWPNDLLKEGKKLGGVLIETQVGLNLTNWAVIGIGLNLRASSALENEIGQAVADLPWLAQMNPNDLLAELLQALQSMLTEFNVLGFRPFHDRWNQLHAYAQQTVSILDRGIVKQQGIAMGVDEDGCMLLRTSAGIQRIHTGDVSLRALE
ncbi:biotin--[acetyl-CoA-carboxylase] ligase [Undibacterium fentianense]|uniref:biotin--[biotin carboxyl-carrier protein] ligase n=1 Tax=Undibacterium fentianense TaxID=2828728 RepID=A0A941E353_9BURK|nr:biotin--[acetyl-CoA-carboxylase] ligase [Undibacterium fentianense]MBR7799769.1 biotin--[acetyl-CoA-carboxylase] ligase [Undibacterium fentianense]